MTCKEYALLLQDLLDGLLDHSQAEAMYAHEATCPACKAAREELETLLQDLQTLDADTQIPDDCANAWRDAVRKEAAQPQVKKNPFRRYRAWVAAAAAALCVIGGTSLMRAGYLPGTPEYLQRTGTTANEPSYLANRQIPYAAPMVYGANDYDMEEAYDDGANDGMNLMSDSASANRSMLAAEPQMAKGTADIQRTEGASDSFAGAANVNEGGADEAKVTAPKIIRSASLHISSTSFDADTQAIVALITQAGGWVEYESVSGEPLSRNPEGGRYSYYTMRVPTESLNALIESLSQIGVLDSKNISATDISDQYHDTEGRLRMYETQRDRLMALLESAQSVTDMVEIEGKLGEILYQIESLTGTLRHWDSRIDYSELSVQVTEKADLLRVQPAKDSLGERIREGLYKSANAVVRFARDAAVFLVIALPWLVGGVVVIALAAWIVRLTKRRK